MRDEDILHYQSGIAGVKHRNINAAGNDHPFGNEPKPFEADLRPLIREVADDLYESWRETIREYLANAETACLKVERFLEGDDDIPYDDMIVGEGYEPRIIVVWDKSEQKLTISDNGIGMAAIEVDKILRHVGRSATRDLGQMTGSFGIGSLSFHKFIGPHNTMIMRSHSRLNDDNASYLITLAGIEPVVGKMDEEEYGTTFELDQKKEDMEIRDAVKTYAESMRVPVLYRELDKSNSEVFNEDWGDKRLYDDYSSGAFVDEINVAGCFEAYMSADASGETLLLSMPVDRSARNMTAPYEFDVRLLDESGKVCISTNGNEGLIPVSDFEYEQILLDERDGHITESLLNNKDVVGQYAENGDERFVVVPDEVLEDDEPLPMVDGEYVAESNVDEYDTSGVGLVVLGPHRGRKVVSEEVWDDLPEGRAAQFVPEDELEGFDVESETGDLCLPEPTTDRSSLKEHETFWKYLTKRFEERYDRYIEEARQKLRKNNNNVEALKDINAKTVERLQ